MLCQKQLLIFAATMLQLTGIQKWYGYEKKPEVEGLE